MTKFVFIITIFLLVPKCQGFLNILSQFTEDTVRQYGKNIVERPPYSNSYDFIIVGSGPAGCVLANRLSSNKTWRVLLIEAGPVETIFQSIPLNAPYQVASRYNWGYLAEPQNYSCLGTAKRRCSYPRGKALGGSSVINGMLYTRGSIGDFDHWAELGVEGWDYYEDILPAFKKSEHAELKDPYKAEFHGKDGPVSVVHNEFSTPMADIFADGMKSLGFDEIDFNSNDSIGFGRVQSTTKDGMRQSAFESYIRPVLGRRNLHIMVNTRVVKILINPSTKEAYGVQIHRDKRRLDILAFREVILSAGTFHSPQLLTLSGIAAAQDLKRLKIPIISDLPVGKVMYDHLTFGGVFVTLDLKNNLAFPLEPQLWAQLTADWLDGKGLFTIPNGVEMLAFVKVGNSTTPVESQPNIEYIVLGANAASDGGYGLKNGEEMSEFLYDNWLKPLENRTDYIMPIGITLLHPKSVGYVEVTSKNIYKRPKLYSNFLKEPDDVETLLDGVRFLQKLIETPPFEKFNAKFYDLPMPMCDLFEFDSDEYWRCAIRTFSVSLHHQVGTCKMGGPDDPTAVVDSTLKVRGLKKLRVFDTSVIPAATSAHTNALSFMIGERGAEFIQKDYVYG